MCIRDSTLALSGCAPGAGTVAGTSPPTARASVNTDPASMGTITLTVWDQEVRGGQNDEVEDCLLYTSRCV